MSTIAALNIFLKKPFPREVNIWVHLVSPAVIVFLFISFFNPHNLLSNVSRPNLVAMGYIIPGIIGTAMALLLYPYLFPRFFNFDKWTNGKRFLEQLLILLTVTVCNYIYSMLFANLQMEFIYAFFYVMLLTSLIAIPLFVGFNLAMRIVHLKQVISNVTETNELITSRDSSIPASTIEIKNESNKTALRVQASDLLHIQAEGNYLNISYLKNGVCKSSMIRNTLKYMEQLLIKEPYLYKCHRSYIVNIRQVRKLKSSVNKYRIILNHACEDIPVSRNCIKSIKERLTVLPIQNA